jgi:signal transduction histidine kinase
METFETNKEVNRLRELRKYGILDSLLEKDYDNITHMASIICDVPIALISFVDENRQWFKSHRGLPISETSREYSFCAHAINPSQEIFIVPDSRNDKRFRDNPYVTGDPNIVFYAGVPLINDNGYTLGTVCVIDKRARELTGEQLSALKILSSQVINLLELRKINIDLSATTQRLELALKAARLGSYDLDLKSGQMETSRQCKENYGFNQQDEFNFPELLSRILPEDLPGMQAAIKISIDNNIAYNAEYRITLPGREIRWIKASGLPIYNDALEATRMAGVSLDITSQKNFTIELEKQVTARTEELKLKNLDLESMNKELQSFAYVSSHDLQEPLRKIRTFSERILIKSYDTLSDQSKDYFKRIQGAAGRMQELIDDLLKYSRTNNSERIYEYVDLTKIVHAVKEDLKEELQSRNATIELANVGNVKIIPFQFKQLLYNLFSNSIKFSSPKVPLTIKISCNTDQGRNFYNDRLAGDLKYCHISVSDNGIGFEQQYSEKVFGLFERLNGKY